MNFLLFLLSTYLSNVKPALAYVRKNCTNPFRIMEVKILKCCVNGFVKVFIRAVTLFKNY